GILFAGASGIRLWKTLAQDFPGLPVMNRGFGGAQFSDMVHFADRVITNYRPSVIVLQGAANDLNAKKTPEQVLTDFKSLTAKLRHALPDTKIVFLGINPSPSRWEQREAQQTTNELLKEHLRSLRNTVFVDLWDDMLGANGQPREELFVADKLHPSALEYKRRAELIMPHLKSNQR
ncbi:MAG: hypothetical protein H7X97_07605, partial [Opitutaceae bacterium]|nr:hypothetical protein [Verrucomicrobiales bacterium]